MVYEFQDYRQMVRLYDINRNNAAQAAREYRQLFPGRGCPDHHTVLGAVRRLDTTGNLMPQRNESRYQVRDNWIQVVLDHFANDPGTSTRKAENELGIPATTIGTILRENGVHPYHYT
ncbi:hypothetical protein QAD02_002099 [Eretmocerus hayati]|uniref:Uncharacterized protein n=1 Tax=Eretmocerus hayati TaxID=131215 RepID=A0ACC2NHZ4_9HYME|nr:hypothetical protein QAD02_002099 [Eretmocerus hayati]